MKTVIMAGGKGTRIAGLDSSVPKPMLPVLGRPVLQHQIECLKNQGYKDITLIVGHMGHKIEDYFGDGTSFGVSIAYVKEDEPLGTAGALCYLKDMISDDFLLINGDLVFHVDIPRFVASHKSHKGLATIFTHPNDHPYDSAIIAADGFGRVTNWFHKEEDKGWYKNRVNAGLHILSPLILKLLNEPKKLDLDRDVLKPIIPTGELFVYDSSEYVKDMGTPERYSIVEADIQGGKVMRRSLGHKQKAIFLDRDGTINKNVGFLANIVDFELIDGVSDAIRRINRSDYLAVVITNQPVIARGEITWEQLNEIHNKMETLLGRNGAFIDGVFVCPHHPHGGYPGERVEYKVDCSCRKPKPGMLVDASMKLNIDLSKSFMIGDSLCDIQAGAAAGCRTVKIGAGTTLTMAIDSVLSREDG